MRLKSFRCAAVIFDLDGVLVDSTHSVSRQWRIWANENNLEPARILEIAHGRRTAEVVELLTPHLAVEDEVTKIEQREAADTDGVRVMPGAPELVAAIPDGYWCVVTSGTRYLATSRLRLAGIRIPKVLVSAEDVVKGKPAPEPYLKGARMLGMEPAQCLVIEDAPAGILSAHAAGMKVVALTSTYPASELGEADGLVQSIAQIRLSFDAACRGQALDISIV